MWNQKDDVEALLYPSMEERPELRWAFIRKVYSILALQLLTTIAVAAAVSALHPIAIFFATTWVGLTVYIVFIVAILIGKPILNLQYLNLSLVDFFIYIDCCSYMLARHLPRHSPPQLHSAGDLHTLFWLSFRPGYFIH